MVHDDGPVGLDGVRVQFDDERVVSDAGIALAATLAARLGIEALVGRFVRLRSDRPGSGNAGREVMALIYAMALGADSIDDCDVLRAAAAAGFWAAGCRRPRRWARSCVRLPSGMSASSTACSQWRCSVRGRPAPGPGDGRLTVNVDGFVGEVWGHVKQGAAFGYTRKRG